MSHTPTARRDGLIVRELEDETLVYDLDRDEAHCLNQTATLIWKHCDGQTTVAEITQLFNENLESVQGGAKTSARCEVDEQVVWLALSQLRRKRLLTEKVTRPRSTLHISRREMAHKIAQATVLALPLITTIAAPRPASAASCSSNCGVPPTAECCGAGCPCNVPNGCCSGECVNGQCT
jgi:hypothetical protein